MTYKDHPISDLLDAAAAGARPSNDELDQAVTDALRSDLEPGAISAAGLRARLERTVEQALRLHAEGSYQDARRLAGDTARELVTDQLPAYHRPDPAAGKPMAEIIDSIPRGA